MNTSGYLTRFCMLLLTAVLACSATAWAGGGYHGHGGHARYSVGLGLNFGYPGPYPGGYYGPPYRYYPAYPHAYRPFYGGSIGIGYRTGFHDSFGLSFSIPLYFGPRYAPPQPVPVAVPVPQVASRQVLADCQVEREYQTEVVIGGQSVPAWGTACLQADGSWRVVSGPFAEE